MGDKQDTVFEVTFRFRTDEPEDWRSWLTDTESIRGQIQDFLICTEGETLGVTWREVVRLCVHCGRPVMPQNAKVCPACFVFVFARLMDNGSGLDAGIRGKTVKQAAEMWGERWPGFVADYALSIGIVLPVLRGQDWM